MTLRISGARGMDLFVGELDRPLQVVRVELRGTAGDRGEVRVTSRRGSSASMSVAASSDEPVHVLVPVELSVGTGESEEVAVVVDEGGSRSEERFHVRASEPGWTVHMVPHFHFDPVWWNSQANFTDEWPEHVKEHHPYFDFQGAAFDVVDAHLDLAEREGTYRFVLAELDYLKPYWDSRPARRGLIRRLLAEGRLELVGGTYNEPNTNLSSPEATLRNAVYGMAFQRFVLGGDPGTTWQLDVFGHDPSYPSLMASAGLHNTSWARGPFHQNGPTYDYGPNYAPFFHREGPFRDPKRTADARRMQFPSEFEWVSPDGVGLPTAYMTGHYLGGWRFNSAEDLEVAIWSAFAMFEQLKPVAASRQVLLPVGTDFARPNRWTVQLVDEWNHRYLSPRFIISTPRQFFAALHDELGSESRALLPQTRDMNPVWTGKDVSLIDTKRAQRMSESRLGVAEAMATIAASLGSAYPLEALDLAWRQVLFGAHHDAVTGTCSDQVFVDLLGSWREAVRLTGGVVQAAMDVICGAVDTSELDRPVVVFNPEPWARTEVVSVELEVPPARSWCLRDADGRVVPAVLGHEPMRGRELRHGGALLHFVGQLQPGGVSTFALAEEAGTAGTPVTEGGLWSSVGGREVSNEHFYVRAEPGAGGGLGSIVHLSSGRELVAQGGVANELVLYDEYAEHPVLHEGPWHLSPTGRAVRASANEAAVFAERSSAGERLVVKGGLGTLNYEQQVTLWSGVDRVDVCTTVHDFKGSDQLLRVVFPFDLPGGLPFAEAGLSVVGRSFAFPCIDTAKGSWTLDTPAFRFAGIGTTASVRLVGTDGSAVRHALAVGEVVLPSANEGQVARPLVVALARAGVTSTTSVASGPRYGALEVDSNVPDFRIAIGGPAENTFVAKLLAGLDRGAARECNEMLDNGHAPVWVPASVGSRKLLGPSADVRGDRDLPVLIVPARDGFAAACARLVEDLDDAEICGLRLGQIKDTAVEAEDFTVAVINKGTPGFAVDPDGRFYLSLMRSCTGWPSGVWVDEPARPTPDGSGYHLSHWDHRFEYSIVAGQGDWRAMRLPARASELNRPPVAREATPGSGPLPPAHSFYSLSPAREVLMSALKLRGNPHAEGREARVVKDPEVTIRLYAAGTPRTATITEAMGLGQLRVTDALELDPGKPLAGRAVELAAWRAITVNAPLPIRQLSTTALMEGPAHARYWMHNSGAAPAGFVPVALHLEPREMDLGVEPATVRLSISSDRTDAAVQRHVSLVLPEGWSGDAECFPVELAPGQSWSRELKVQASSGAPPGIYFLKAIMRDELGRELQDTTRIGLGTLTSADRDLLVEVMEKELRIPRNGHRSLHVKLTNQTRSAIDCRLDAIAPLDAWSLLPSPTVLVTVAPMSHTEVHVPVVAGPAFPGGKWWALVKAMWFAQRSYSEALVLEV